MCIRLSLPGRIAQPADGALEPPQIPRIEDLMKTQEHGFELRGCGQHDLALSHGFTKIPKPRPALKVRPPCSRTHFPSQCWSLFPV